MITQNGTPGRSRFVARGATCKSPTHILLHILDGGFLLNKGRRKPQERATPQCRQLGNQSSQWSCTVLFFTIPLLSTEQNRKKHPVNEKGGLYRSYCLLIPPTTPCFHMPAIHPDPELCEFAPGWPESWNLNASKRSLIHPRPSMIAGAWWWISSKLQTRPPQLSRCLRYRFARLPVGARPPFEGEGGAGTSGFAMAVT